MPAGMPFTSKNRSNDTGSLATGAFRGVFTSDAIRIPRHPDPSEQAKITSYGHVPCMNSPIIGPKLIARLFASP